jgi:valyl-tRNA synthetase
MADAIYHFVWDQFCDWYLELIKPAFVDGEKQDMDAESKLVAGWVLDQILVMLHPFMPFITEELWHALADPAHPRKYDLIHAKWPEPKAGVDAEARAEIDWLIQLTGELRAAKAELGIAPGARTDILVDSEFRVADDGRMKEHIRPDVLARFQTQQRPLANIARLNVVQFLHTGTAFDLRDGRDIDRTVYESPGKSPLQFVVEGVIYTVPVEEHIDLDAERTRITKAIEAAAKERDALAGRLNNPAFVEKAKPEAVEKARADHAEKAAEAARLTAALARLG